jgi:DNA-binding transcriptional LysR family regulator
MLDFDRLRALVAVADHGSMTGAAAALCRTQPSISRQIAALERQTGVPLLVRTPTGTSLTPAGALLVEHTRGMLDRLHRAERQLAALGGDGGSLTIGSFSSANTTLMPQALRAYMVRHPLAAKPFVPLTDPERHLADLRAGRLDLALVTEWDLHAQDLDGIELIPLAEDELLVALPDNHPFARGRLALTDLSDDTWIDGAHPDCLGPLDGFVSTVSVRCDDWTGKQGLVASGVGVMLFPSLALPSMRRDIVVRRPSDEIPRRRLYLACPVGGRRVPALWSMVEVMRAAAAVLPGDRRALPRQRHEQ